MEFTLGLDLGQSRDPSALAIVRRVLAPRFLEPHYHVQHLHRWPLGTSYPAIGDDVKALMGRRELCARSCCVLDYTGCGRPVLDMMKQQGVRPLIGITLTAGQEPHSTAEGENVPKRDLVSLLVVLLQNGRLKIASSLPFAQVLLAELLNFRVKISEAGRDTWEALREGDHDDLVLALGIACWWAEKHGRPGTPVAGGSRPMLEAARRGLR
jgi:hypothetical protein